MEISITLNNKLVYETSGKEILKNLSKRAAVTLLIMTMISISKSTLVCAAAKEPVVKVVADEIFNILKTPTYDGPPLKCYFPLDMECFKYIGTKSVEAFLNNNDNAVRVIKFMNGGF